MFPFLFYIKAINPTSVATTDQLTLCNVLAAFASTVVLVLISALPVPLGPPSGFVQLPLVSYAHRHGVPSSKPNKELRGKQ